MWVPAAVKQANVASSETQYAWNQSTVLALWVKNFLDSFPAHVVPKAILREMNADYNKKGTMVLEGLHRILLYTVSTDLPSEVFNASQFLKRRAEVERALCRNPHNSQR